MGKHLARRVLSAIGSLLGVSILVFLLSRSIGDPASLLVPLEASPEQYQLVREELGLDKPLYYQYAVFFRNAVLGDMGESIRYRMPVLGMVLSRLPATIYLAAAASVLGTLIGVLGGILGAIRANSLYEKAVNFVSLIGQAAPPFWLGLMFLTVFAVRLRLLPAGGDAGVKSLILPAITLGWYVAAPILRLTRSALMEVITSDYILVARSKGVGPAQVLFRHALRNAAIPILTITSLQLGRMLGGAVVVETVFDWQGVGSLAVQAVLTRDYPLTQGIVLITCSVFIVLNLTVDVLYGFVDPRVRA
jgi:ABC-type dipeptide/oligopeptide/nickel transport system permease component